MDAINEYEVGGDLARTRIDAPEVRRYARSLEGYTRALAE